MLWSYLRTRFPTAMRLLERRHYVSDHWIRDHAYPTRVEFHGVYIRFPLSTRTRARYTRQPRKRS